MGLRSCKPDRKGLADIDQRVLPAAAGVATDVATHPPTATAGSIHTSAFRARRKEPTWS